MSWQGHQEAAYAAIAAVGETQKMISALRDKAESDLATVNYATGGNDCHMDSGRNAYEFAAMAIEAIDGLFRHTEETIAELQRYANGF